MEELKPCPFCGEKDNLRVYTTQHDYGFPETYSAGCKHCGASTKEYAKPEHAIDAWNSRVVGS